MPCSRAPARRAAAVGRKARRWNRARPRGRRYPLMVFVVELCSFPPLPGPRRPDQRCKVMVKAGLSPAPSRPNFGLGTPVTADWGASGLFRKAYSLTERSRVALAMTLTEDSAMAAAAM